MAIVPDKNRADNGAGSRSRVPVDTLNQCHEKTCSFRRVSKELRNPGMAWMISQILNRESI